MIMGIPADLGEWTVTRIFHESGRLMKKHFGDMLFIVLLFTLPASLFKVWHSQFRWIERHQGSRDDREPVSTWSLVLYDALDLASGLLLIYGFIVMVHVQMQRIYPDGECSPSFFTTLKSAFRWKKTLTDSHPRLLNENPHNDNFLKGCGAILLCIVLYSVISTSGVNFTPEAVAEMGLPPWTVFVFTVLVAAIMAVSISYLHLTGLLVLLWTKVPLDVESCG